MSKYKTREEAIKAVSLDGRALAEVDSRFQDDEEIVQIALEHGGILDHASVRIRTDSDRIISEVLLGDGFVFNFDKAIFAAKRNFDACQKLTQLYRKSTEFQIEMKLTYGCKYISPIRKLNFFSDDQLRAELYNYRKSQVEDARNIYKQGCDAEYIQDHYDLDIVAGHSALQWGAVELREQGLPFSLIVEHYPKQIEYIKYQIQDYCSESLSGSYPERLMNSLLLLLGVDFAREQTFEWSTNVIDENGRSSTKRYDFYIPSLSTIIEVHGAQHYEGGFEHLGGRTLEEEQANDRQKQRIAKENGITHYIVINALSSTLSFIKESIATNQEFVALFDITGIDWNKVESGTVAKVKTDVSFPLYEEMKARCDEWVAVIKEALVADDNIPLDSTNKLLKAKGTVSPKLLNNIKNSFPSKNGLYPHEILILREAPRYHFPLGDQFVPAKWYYDYDVNDIEPHLVSLVERGFLTTGNLRATIEHSTVPVIKRVLTEHELPTKGKKEELIDLLLSSVTEAELLKIFPDKYLILTELGEQELEKNSYLFTLQRGTYLSVWTLNRLVNAFPNDSVDTLLYEYERNPRRFLKYLSKDECENLGIRVNL